MKKILFVCLGNICRSPAAEGILKKYVEKENLNGKFQIDSAGILDYHESENYDPRMISHAAKRGYNLIGTSRPLENTDLENFDIIIAMDNEVYDSIKSFDNNKKYSHKIFRMTDFYSKTDYSEVPDPYYSNANGFNIVLDILEDSCRGLLNKMKRDANS